MNQFVKTPVTLNEAGGTRMLTDEELDEVNGGVGLLGLAILLTVAAVAGVCVGTYWKNHDGSSGAGSGAGKAGDYPTGSNGTAPA
jgi:lactobin A/cerein 7B family class IIb bacteriocin